MEKTINNKTTLGLIAFANNSGLGSQSRSLFFLLRPERVLLVDSRPFSPNKQFHASWFYSSSSSFSDPLAPPSKTAVFVSNGFPTNEDLLSWLPGLTHVFVLENAYNHNIFYYAKTMNIRSIIQPHYEFFENIESPYLPKPDMVLLPTSWHKREVEQAFGSDRVAVVPPPLLFSEFNHASLINLLRSKKKASPRRFLHPIGTLAYKDRNGTGIVIDAIKKTSTQFEIVFHSQHPLPSAFFLDDPRVSYWIEDFSSFGKRYENFDAVILPRRYGGLCLPCNEALASSLPVVMPAISPNTDILPSEWLVPAEKEEEIHVKTSFFSYAASSSALAKIIDTLATMSDSELLAWKRKARKIAESCFSFPVLSPLYTKYIYGE